MNRVQLIGNLGKDPEIKYTNKGTAVANFSVATTESYKDKNDEWQKTTSWHNIVAWDKKAEAVSKLVKGDSVFIEGKLQTRSYEDKSGTKKYVTEVVASEIHKAEFLNAPKPAAGSSSRTASNAPISDDDIPF